MVIEAGTIQASPRFVRKFNTLFCRWLILYTDYLIREVVSLTKGGIEPAALSPIRTALREADLNMAPVISVLCFVSRMRMRDREPTNGIHLGFQMFDLLHRFFGRAAIGGMVSGQYRSYAIWPGLIVVRVEPEQRGRYVILPRRSE